MNKAKTNIFTLELAIKISYLLQSSFFQSKVINRVSEINFLNDYYFDLLKKVIKITINLKFLQNCSLMFDYIEYFSFNLELVMKFLKIRSHMVIKVEFAIKYHN